MQPVETHSILLCIELVSFIGFDLTHRAAITMVPEGQWRPWWRLEYIASTQRNPIGRCSCRISQPAVRTTARCVMFENHTPSPSRYVRPNSSGYPQHGSDTVLDIYRITYSFHAPAPPSVTPTSTWRNQTRQGPAALYTSARACQSNSCLRRRVLPTRSSVRLLNTCVKYSGKMFICADGVP